MAALVLSAAAVLTPTHGAHAEADSRLFLLVADRAPHSSGGLFLGPSLSQAQTPVIPDDDNRSASAVSASRTAQRFATVEYRYDPSAPLDRRNNIDLVAYDSSGEQVERVTTDGVSSSSRVVYTGIAVSPDGARVAWSKYTGSSNLDYWLDLYTSVIGSGVVTKVDGGNDLERPVFLDDLTLLASNHSTGAQVTLPVLGGSPQPAVNDPAVAGRRFVVSPDGTQLAWDQQSERTTADGYPSNDVYSAPFTVTDGIATFGARHRLTSSADNVSPAWATGDTLDFVRDEPGPDPVGAVWTAPADGSSAPTQVPDVPAGNSTALAIGVRETTPPGATTILPIALGGTAATVAWQLPTDPDVAGALITRTLGPDTTAPVFVRAPLTRFRDTGLVVGTTYTYTVNAVDRSGNVGPPAFRKAQALHAGAVAATPTSTTGTGLPFPVTLASGNPADTTYSADVSVNGGPLGSWTDHQPGASRTYTDVRQGDTYRFGVTAFDAFGNSTPRVVSGPTVVPFDQTVARRLSQTTTARYVDAFGHGVNVLKAPGAAIDVISVGHTLQVIGTRCPSCGSFDVLYGGRRLGTANSFAASRQPRAVLLTVTWTSNARRDVVLVNRSAAGRWVYLDAFAMTR